MSAILQVPASFQFVTGQVEVKVQGNNIAQVLRNFADDFPDLVPHMYDGEHLRPFMRVYLNEEEMTYLKGPATPVRDGDCIAIVPTVGTPPES